MTAAELRPAFVADFPSAEERERTAALCRLGTPALAVRVAGHNVVVSIEEADALIARIRKLRVIAIDASKGRP